MTDHPEAQQVFLDREEADAYARRRTLLYQNQWTLSDTEEVLFRMLTLPPKHMSRGAAVDKLTALALFRMSFPGEAGIAKALAAATHSLRLPGSSLTVYRLLSRDWIQPKTKHYIHASMPWAQMFERELQAQPAPAAAPPPEVLPNNPMREEAQKLLRKSG